MKTLIVVVGRSSPIVANVAIETGRQQVQQRRRRIAGQAQAWRDGREQKARTIPNHAHQHAIAKSQKDLPWQVVSNQATRRPRRIEPLDEQAREREDQRRPVDDARHARRSVRANQGHHERKKGDRQEKNEVDPQNRSIRAPDIVKLESVADPERPEDDEAAREAEGLRRKGHQRRQQVSLGRYPFQLGDMQLEDEDRHGDRKNAVGERFDAVWRQPDESFGAPVVVGLLHAAKGTMTRSRKSSVCSPRGRVSRAHGHRLPITGSLRRPDRGPSRRPRIELPSEVGRGTTVTVRLPLREAAAMA